MMIRPRSRASTPLAIADVEIEEREFRWTTISRFDFFPSDRRKARSGVAIAGWTVFSAFASINHRLAPGRGTRKSTSRPCWSRK